MALLSISVTAYDKAARPTGPSARTAGWGSRCSDQTRSSARVGRGNTKRSGPPAAAAQRAARPAPSVRTIPFAFNSLSALCAA